MKMTKALLGGGFALLLTFIPVGHALADPFADSVVSVEALNSAPAVLDSDGDGIPDDEEACSDSDLSATVVIDSCDSGVENQLFDDGYTILALPPWRAFIEGACPRTKAMPSRAQRSASQYQVKMHSTATP